MTQEQNKLSTRLISLDVFRGIAIAGMILVNQAGVADKVYPFLAHADWNGCTLADLVFPFFLFIVGVAIAFSFSKYGEGATPPASVYWRILRRSLILFALGILLNGFWNYNWDKIRIMGVLQRISVSYLLASLAVLKLPRKGLWALAILLLVGYWIAMTVIPVPGYGANVLTREGNFGAYIDRLIIPSAHLYRGDSYNSLGDPEGVFSTLPAVVTVLLGYFTGQRLRQRPIDSNKSMDLVLFGLGSLIIGILWDGVFPINKKLWTSSYVVFTAGWALLVLAACYELIEVRKIRRWGKPFAVMGVNAIAIFVASVLVIKILVKTQVGNASSTFEWIYQNIFASWAGGMNGSLLFALVTLLFWWVVAYGMYRRGWFIKV
ncbi:acyltransferase family protein [Microseira sp. BLCC-F43]|jgi:predicted acyltransferase|uniref:acyltransferase family protein n=1 Tax=Microseira sp. BLCC-F43 TaxID=3153602 RepID=UPI0035B743E6